MMQALKWPQVGAWRLSQHGLSPHLSSGEVVEAVKRTAGIQAQVMSAAELALASRVEGLSAREIRSALWPEHTLVKTWAMRGHPHIWGTVLAAKSRELTEDRGSDIALRASDA